MMGAFFSYVARPASTSTNVLSLRSTDHLEARCVHLLSPGCSHRRLHTCRRTYRIDSDLRLRPHHLLRESFSEGAGRSELTSSTKMAGLVSNAGAFFTFYALTLSGYFALAAFFRLLGTICSNYDVAARLASVLITGMVLYSVSISSLLLRPRLQLIPLAGLSHSCSSLLLR